jgi:hypothetical protein
VRDGRERGKHAEGRVSARVVPSLSHSCIKAMDRARQLKSIEQMRDQIRDGNWTIGRAVRADRPLGGGCSRAVGMLVGRSLVGFVV